MKNLKIILAATAVFLFAVSLSSNIYSNNKTDDLCKCCDSVCVETKCCTGSAQGTAGCCTDKCTSEKCKECCVSGKCMMKDDMKKSDTGMNMDNKENSSCCTKATGSTEKGCCNKWLDYPGTESVPGVYLKIF